MLVSIVYSSAAGETANQATSVAGGARSVPGVEVRLVDLSIDEAPWEVLESSAGIVFGSSSRNGTVSPEMKRFFEDSRGPAWLQLRWRDKVAAGFTSGAERRGDELDTLVTMASFAAQHGMLWVGLDLSPRKADRAVLRDLVRYREALGAMTPSMDGEESRARPPDIGLRLAAYLGHRVALVARRLQRGS